VSENRWLDPHQPQTLRNATILCYIDAVFGLLLGGVYASSRIAILFVIVGLGAGGFGIANEKKWGYALAVAAAIVQMVSFLLIFRLDFLGNVNLIITFGFDAVLLALLLHPHSREYQKIWFK
jgi:hypothetical protein